MNIEFLQRYVDRRERRKTGKMDKLLTFIFAPYYFLMEYLTIRGFWKFITDEMGDNEELVRMLDRNEFGIGKWKIYKKDFVDPGDDLDIYGLKDLKKMYESEYAEALSKLLKNSSFDIENYVSLTVNFYLHKTKESSAPLKMYEIAITYYRLPAYLKMKRIFTRWVLFVIGICIGIIEASFLISPGV